MQRIDGPTRSATLPAPGATGAGASAPGFFTNGDPVAGTPPTTVSADWFNMVQEEMLGPIEAAGIAPDKNNHGQLLQALDQRYVRADPEDGGDQGGAGINPAAGEFAFAGGGFCKVGVRSGTLPEGQVPVNFLTPFPHACLSLQLTAIDANGSTLRDFTMQVVSMSAAGFVAMVQKNGGDGSNIDGFTWDAKGY